MIKDRVYRAIYKPANAVWFNCLTKKEAKKSIADECNRKGVQKTDFSIIESFWVYLPSGRRITAVEFWQRYAR